jgi:hypothetical protein
MPNSIQEKLGFSFGSVIKALGVAALCTVSYPALLGGRAALSAHSRRNANELFDLSRSPELMDRLTVDDNNPQSITDLLLRNSLIGDRDYKDYSAYNELTRAKLAGPWNIDDKSYEITRKMSENIAFDSALKCAALDNLDPEKFPFLLFSPTEAVGRKKMLQVYPIVMEI